MKKKSTKAKLDFESLSDELFKEVSQPDMLSLKGGYGGSGPYSWTLPEITVYPSGGQVENPRDQGHPDQY